jgi:transglutaminase-like putative cysteine protease
VIGKTDAFSGEWQLHAWVETCVNGAWQVFDSNLDRSKGSALTWYQIPTDGSDERYKHYQGEWSRNV